MAPLRFPNPRAVESSDDLNPRRFIRLSVDCLRKRRLEAEGAASEAGTRVLSAARRPRRRTERTVREDER